MLKEASKEHFEKVYKYVMDNKEDVKDFAQVRYRKAARGLARQGHGQVKKYVD